MTCVSPGFRLVLKVSGAAELDHSIQTLYCIILSSCPANSSPIPILRTTGLNHASFLEDLSTCFKNVPEEFFGWLRVIKFIKRMFFNWENMFSNLPFVSLIGNINKEKALWSAGWNLFSEANLIQQVIGETISNFETL